MRQRMQKAFDAVMAEIPEIKNLRFSQSVHSGRNHYNAAGWLGGKQFQSKSANKTPLGAAHNLVQKIKRATAKGGELPGEHRVVPDETVEAPVHQQKPDPSRERVSCPTCDKTFSGAAVLNIPDKPSVTERREPGMYRMKRVAYCDHCDHLWWWREACDNLCTRPLGHILQAPVFERDKKIIQRFLEKNPQCAGVAQS